MNIFNSKTRSTKYQFPLTTTNKNSILSAAQALEYQINTKYILLNCGRHLLRRLNHQVVLRKHNQKQLPFLSTLSTLQVKILKDAVREL